jgi:Uma2 family endonuclease
MNTIMCDSNKVQIPSPAVDLATFRRWAHSDEFPEKGHVAYLAGEVGVDMSEEQFAHNQVKGEVTGVLTALAKQPRLGRVFPDGYLLTNTEANLSTNPDGIFASNESLALGRARRVPGTEEGHVELEGTPDMVLEVISPSSLEKDTEIMPKLYWRAGIAEYWLIDVRGDRLEFRILFDTSITDAGLKELALLKSLQHLNLFKTRVTDAGLKELAGLKGLQTLIIGRTQITDAGLKELAGLAGLRLLDLTGTEVTDAGLKELAGLKGLKLSQLRDAKVTDAGVAELEKATPALQIIR